MLKLSFALEGMTAFRPILLADLYIGNLQDFVLQLDTLSHA